MQIEASHQRDWAVSHGQREEAADRTLSRLLEALYPYHQKLGEKQKRDKKNPQNHSYANYPEMTTVNILLFSFQILFDKETFTKSAYDKYSK